MSEWTESELIMELRSEALWNAGKKISAMFGAAADALARHQWVSVEDRLPEESGQLYMVYNKGAGFGAMVFDDGKFTSFTLPDIKPSHWMELPEPPEGANRYKNEKWEGNVLKTPEAE